MAKHGAAEEVSNGRTRDRLRGRDSVSGSYTQGRQNAGRPTKGVRREILFPTEPSTIGDKKIDRAIKQVVSRKNK